MLKAQIPSKTQDVLAPNFQYDACCNRPIQPRLRVLGSALSITIENAPSSIGTASENAMVLKDPFVSKRHCSIHGDRDKFWIQDEGSRNGTWVDNTRVERAAVRVDSKIVVGRTHLQVVLPHEATSAFGIVGEHSLIKNVLRKIVRYASCSIPVLIQGETGTGKELVARALHTCSNVCKGSFEPINCGAIPKELAESEFLGHAAGAFTGAAKARKGAFERASGGTIFLDEVGELPLAIQPKILRILEEQAVQRIGEDQRRPIDVRIITATNRELQHEIKKENFRLDLYHRLAVGIIELPPLRERAEDIPLLINHFLHEIESTYHFPMKADESAVQYLAKQQWPGNIRELKNALYRASFESGPLLTVNDFRFLEVGEHSRQLHSDGHVQCVGRRFSEIRREVYAQVLKNHRGNRSAAAMALGVPKSTFFDHIREMNL